MAFNADEKRVKLAAALQARQLQNLAKKVQGGKDLTKDEWKFFNSFMDEAAEENGQIERFWGDKEVAAHYGVKVPTVYNHKRKGNITKNPDGTYDKSVCDAYWVEKLGRKRKPIRQKSEPKIDVESPPATDPAILKKIDEQKYRKIKAEADVKEFMASQMRDNLVPRDVVVQAWGSRYRMFREALLNLADRLPPLLVNREQLEIETLLRDEAYSILTGFSKDGKYTPKPCD